MIISDNDVKFTSNFSKSLFAGLETRINFSTSYHLEIDGKTERTNQTIKNMLRMYVMKRHTQWENYLRLVEFAYNNVCQASAKMSPFEILYGRKCNTPVSWDNPVDCVLIGPELLQEMEQIVCEVQRNLKAAQERQNHYTDLKRKHKEYCVGDHM